MATPSRSSVAAFVWYLKSTRDDKGLVTPASAEDCGIDDDEFAMCLEFAAHAGAIKKLWIELDPDALSAIQEVVDDVACEESLAESKQQRIWSELQDWKCLAVDRGLAVPKNEAH